MQEAEKAEAETEKPEEASTSREVSPPLMPGERLIPEHDGIPAMRELVIDLTPRNREERPASVFHYALHEGDTVYLDDRPFIVDRVGPLEVSFRDSSMAYPLFRSESREMLEHLLPRDERNDAYRTDRQQEEEPLAPVPVQQEEKPAAVTPDPTAENFRITNDHLGEGGQKTKFRNNLNAINVLKLIESENRTATPEEQEVLSKYVGWGGIPNAFDDSKPDWAEEYAELKDALTPDEYSAARASTLNAHYTSPTVIRSIYEALGNMGFKTGNILEPAMGVGNFFGMLPEEMRRGIGQHHGQDRPAALSQGRYYGGGL